MRTQLKFFAITVTGLARRSPAFRLAALVIILAFIGKINVPDQHVLFLPAMVLGSWAAVILARRLLMKRQLLLHPSPMEYQLPARVVFTRIRTFLNEASYNMGDSWQVVTADTQAGRIVANLRYADEKTSLHGDAWGHIRIQKERQQRFISLEINIKQLSRGLTMVQLHFVAQSEGANPFACDSVIADVQASISQALSISSQSASKP